MRRPRLACAAVVSLVASLAAVALARARRRAADVPLSPVTAGPHVGPDFPERAGLTTGVEPDGEMDDMADYARSDFDPERVHPEVRRFYEETGDYRMTATVTWHRGFRLGAALAARVTSAVEQLNLPGPYEDSTVALTSRFAEVRADVDPRDEVRAWVRTDRETGEAVFVALYGSHERGGGRDGNAERYANDSGPSGSAGSRPAARYVNIAVPLPWANLSTVLHLDHTDESGRGGDEDGEGEPDGTGIALTTRAGAEPGLYLVTPLGTFELPLEQRFTVRPDESGITATQTMWVCGVRFLTVEYDAVRESDE
ncbi:hypothetical protein [Halarchaeum sp. P4]|uniref:hypothetical protein n=1 Tax=Halarchaeum sp. P4 TaxID=3421639 RepID=UPI003EBC6B55